MSICELYAAYGDQNSPEIMLFRKYPFTGVFLTTVNTGNSPQEVYFNENSETAKYSLKNSIRITINHGNTDSNLVTGEIYAPSGKRVAKLQESAKGNILHRVHGIRPGVSRFFRYEQFNLWVNHQAEKSKA